MNATRHPSYSPDIPAAPEPINWWRIGAFLVLWLLALYGVARLIADIWP